jgi:hypothetical protein
MVSIRPYRPTPAKQSVDETGNPDGQPAHTTLEPRRPVRFHQQVQMILLNAELENAKALVRPCAQGLLDRTKEAFGSEGGKVRARPQRDMGRTARIVREAPDMRNVPTSRVRLAAGSIARAAPCSGAKLQLSSSPPHLETGRKLS